MNRYWKQIPLISNSANMDDATTTPTSTAPDSCSPFTKLPAEIRIAIYRLALQAIIDPFRSGGFEFETSNSLQPKYHGALALLHTNKSIRAESAQEMLAVLPPKPTSFMEEFQKMYATHLASNRHLHKKADRNIPQLVMERVCVISDLRCMALRCLGDSSDVEASKQEV